SSQHEGDADGYTVAVVQPSLRANGSRERAPDDRLCEAIQRAEESLDCFVASAPRNDAVRSTIGYVEPPAPSRPAPMMRPSGASITTAASCPSGKRSLRRSAAPDHWPTLRNERTTLASVSVRPLFSPRWIAVTCSLSK